jgi:hypothetical protein
MAAPLEALLKQKRTEFILPRVVLDEFARNKPRVLKEASRSLAGTFRRVREVAAKHGGTASIRDLGRVRSDQR